MSSHQIEIRDVTRTYGQGSALVRALENVSFEIDSGEFLALAGPSGSGKTTLLNLLGCIDAPSSGQILFEETHLGDLSERQRTDFRNHHIGFIFQSFNLIPVLTASENVELPLQIQGGMRKAERRNAVCTLLEQVGLGDMLHRLPRELSGGQQQRVAIARALVKNPSVLLADEPTANLDSATSREILDLMRSLNQTLGITCVFSTHDPMVMDYARRLVLLHDGQVDKIEDRSEVA